MAKENSNTPSAPPTPEQHRVDDDTLRRWLADCDPYRPLPLEDHRYFDFNEPVPGTDRPLRGRDHIAYLKDAIELSEDGSCQLFSGFGGTGKSTELARLAEDLEGTGYSVLLVNGQDYHDLNHREEHETVARFMDSYLVLCYRNGEDWYEVHPLVREHVTRLAGEVAREGRSGPGEGE